MPLRAALDLRVSSRVSCTIRDWTFLAGWVPGVRAIFEGLRIILILGEAGLDLELGRVSGWEGGVLRNLGLGVE
jgi:hypothetical protein